MKKLSEVATTPWEKILAVAKTAPKEEEKGPTHDKGRGKKSQPGGSQRSDLGPIDIERYLTHYRLSYSVKHAGSKTIYRLSQCLFDPSHKKNEAAIIQDVDGLITYQCFHNSCRTRRWAEARQQISGEDSLAPFCEGYDPKLKRPPKSRASPPVQAAGAYLIFNDGKRPTFNPALMADHLEDRFKPLICEGKEMPEMLYQYDKQRGFWRFLPEGTVRKYARGNLEEHAKPTWIGNAIDLLKMQVYVTEEEMRYDPMWLNVRNGMLHLETKDLNPHAPEFNSRVQLNVDYDPEAKWLFWEDRLVEMFADDPEKIPVLQQFFGYCLYPKILFPCALFQIGEGANGKGVVEAVLCAMLGKENICHISMKRMEDRFGAIELKDKLLNSCGETETGGLDVTNFKKIATGDEVQAEMKYHGDVKFTPIAKHMISMNAFPAIREKTDAFFRRVLVLEYKQKFEGKKDDKRLKDKLIDEHLDGIFNWSLKGLEKVLENNEIGIPDSLAAAKQRFRERANPVLMFVKECCSLGEGYEALPRELYKAYTAWCEEGKIKPLGKQNFYEQLYLNYPGIRKQRSGTKEVFANIGVIDNEQTSLRRHS